MLRKYFVNRLTISIAALIISITSAEIIYRIFTKKPEQNLTVVERVECSIPAYTEMAAMQPNCSGRMFKSINNEVIYDVNISTNTYGFRTVPTGPKKPKVNKAAFFFGSSHEFGWGVNDNETTAYHFQQFSEFDNVQNFSGLGFGIPHLIHLIEEAPLEKWSGINGDKQVYAILGLRGAFFRTVTLNIDTASKYGKLPYYEFDEKLQRFVKGGKLSEVSFKSKFISFLGNSKLISDVVRLLEIADDEATREVETAAKILNQVGRSFSERFKNGKFVVVVGPLTPKFSDKFFDLLDPNYVIVFDLRKHFNPWSEEYRLHKLDNHPSALTNKIVSEKLAEAILSLK